MQSKVKQRWLIALCTPWPYSKELGQPGTHHCVEPLGHSPLLSHPILCRSQKSEKTEEREHKTVAPGHSQPHKGQYSLRRDTPTPQPALAPCQAHAVPLLPQTPKNTRMLLRPWRVQPSILKARVPSAGFEHLFH